MVLSERELIKQLGVFARTISHQPFGMVPHLEDPSAIVNACFQNVEERVRYDGGDEQLGWMFMHRYTRPEISNVGYFIAIHHAVWKHPNGRLIDITPFNPNPNLHPFGTDDEIFFLVDDKAQRPLIEGMGGPLPSRFFPLSTGKKLVAYIEQLRVEEEADCQKYYETMAEQIKAIRQVQDSDDQAA